MVSDSVLFRAVNDPLSDLGHRGSDRIFRRELAPGILSWISFPRSTRGLEKGFAWVLCNVGVVSVVASEILAVAQGGVAAKPQHLTPTISETVSSLFRDGDRAGWELRGVEQGTTQYYVNYETGQGWGILLSDLRKWGIPWIEEHNSIAAMRAWEESQPQTAQSLVWPVLRFLDGDSDGAEEALRGARSWAVWQMWNENALARLDGEIVALRDYFASAAGQIQSQHS